MRISEASLCALAVGLGLGLAPAFAFEVNQGGGATATPVMNLEAPPRAAPPPLAPMLSLDNSRPAPVPPPAGLGSDAPRAAAPRVPSEGIRCGTVTARGPDKPKVLSSLQYAAEQGHPAAQWQLGSMFARGDGVPRDDVKAFDYFSRIAESHADEIPGSPQARIAANAFVALGCYYLEGIANHVRRNPDEARNRFLYAASYFGDAEAQYRLARMMIDGEGGPQTPQQAVKWLGLAAAKGQYQAQAMLGRVLFEGTVVQRQAALGLMWLSLARDSAGPDEGWIVEQWDAAFKQATDDERAIALKYIEDRLQGRRK